MEGNVELRANGIKKSGSLVVTDDTTLISHTDIHLKPVALPEDGVSITAKMAQLLHVQMGDMVEWHIYGSEGWTASEIAGIYREPASQGITMSRAHFESLGLTFHATAILSAETIAAKPGTDAAANSAVTLPEGATSVLSVSDAVTGWDDMTEAMYTMVYVLILAAAILAVVVLYNLGLLSFTEMEREMATLKVMGLKSGKLRGLLLTQNLWFSAIGFVLGVPGGIWLTKLIVNYSGDTFDFPVSLQLSVLLISFVFTFGLSICVNLLFSRKIRRLNMVESLKALE
jgi:putative ABC transport system permease protein